MFSSISSSKGGRVGELTINKRSNYKTPLLYPVVCFLTGTTPRGGGIWKYILQADQETSLLRRNKPVLSQVLHFLNFIPDKPKSVRKWRELGIRSRYNNEVVPNLNYSAPIFLDSGGFQLLRNRNVDLSRYGLSMDQGEDFRSILRLQNDFNGDIVASLDYPLPPGLAAEEVKQRVNRSIDNAVKAALYLQGESDFKPRLYMAVHGQDKESVKSYVETLFQRVQQEGIDYEFGLAIGSLVPLRGARKYQVITDIIKGAIEGIPEERRSLVPIHTFGVNGSVLPILSYLGVDSFDSSTYIQETTNLNYINFTNRQPVPFLKIDNLECDCPVCQKVDLEEAKVALTTDTRGGQPLSSGRYKSEFYAYIALHNLEMDFRIVEETQEAIRADLLQDYLVEYIKRFPSQKNALEAIATTDPNLSSKLERKVVAVPQQLNLDFRAREISLKYNSDSFNILNNGYQPPENKKVLLVIPCSSEKPYSDSHSHRFISSCLSQSLNEKFELIHKVTLSGLYGPVPQEYEEFEEILKYEFHLNALSKSQTKVISDRLIEYIQRHQSSYIACFGYATSKAYRVVLEEASKQVPNLQVLPSNLSTRTRNEFFRRENVTNLSAAIAASLVGQ